MTVKKISVLIDNKIEKAVLDYDEHKLTINLKLKNKPERNYNGLDLYDCFGKILKDLPSINFLCKGAKLNVRPSTMSSQMTAGIMAYDHKIGMPVDRTDIVNIFDYENQNIINDPQLQKDYFLRWVSSLK